ncbi:MAG: tetratricopeptide repeat protein [Bacteroidales bacterium]|nr:tetratricopeptide repeat protein [Bacteroidales bacterium]
MKHNIKILFFFLLIIIGIEPVSAQNQKLDSLNRLISKETDAKVRINHMLEKADLLAIINLDSAIILNLKILEDSKQANFNRGQEEARLKLVYTYSYKGNFNAALGQLRGLQHLVEQKKDSGSFANYYATAGLYYGMQSKYDSSIYFYEKAIPLYEKTGKRERTSQSASNLAIAFQQQSNYSKALYYQQKSLKIHEEDGNISGQAYTTVNMANTYMNMGDKQRAESYFLKSIELSKKKQLTNVELYAYTNLSSMFLDMLQWQKAFDYAIKAAKLGEKMGDKGIQAASFSKAALAKANLNQHSEALMLAKRAIALADTVDQPLITNQAYSSMGFVLKSQKKWKEAIQFYEKSLASLKDADLFIEENGNLFKEMSECYEQTGNMAKALEMYKQYTVIADSVHSRDNIQKATELTMNFEFDKKEQAAKVKQDAKDELNQTRMIGLLSGLGLSLIIIIGALIGYRGKQRANALLRKQNDEIENTLVRLKEAQSQLIHSEKMASLGELTAGIAHEIQNPLNFVNNFSEVSNELIDEMREELAKGNGQLASEIAGDIRQNLEKISHHGKRADAIVKGMLQHSRSSSGVAEPTDINALADEYLRLAYHGLRAKDKDFNANLKTDFDVTVGKINVVPQDIGRVILNLITNAFYAVTEKEKQGLSGYEPTVSVSTTKVRDMIEVKVADNGNGIPQKVLDKIFQPFFTTKPTGQGTGLGLSLAYDIVKAHGGKLKVETKEGDGSVFIIQLPIN